MESKKERLLSKIKNIEKKKLWTIFVGVIFSIAIIIAILLTFQKLFEKIDFLSEGLTKLESDFSSTTERLDKNIIQTYSDLSEIINKEKISVGEIASRLGSYQQEVGTITDTVNTLQKLSKTDPELLQKYSKVFFLNEHYAPASLLEIPKEYGYSDNKTLQIMPEVWPHLKLLLDNAKKDGVDVYVYSAFRSFNEQGALKGQYSVTYGVGTANQFSADQGYSEHQLGTTVDFMTTGINGSLSGFDGTKAYEWLNENAHKYGFTLSYPKNNSYYIYEPWHFRYVGISLATELFNTSKHFYDLDQRVIDEYLVSLF